MSRGRPSARIRLLEDQLGRSLFIRNKAGAAMTPAGEQFLRYAPTLLQVWKRALHQVVVSPGDHAILAVGGELSLWNSLLLRCGVDAAVGAVRCAQDPC